MNNSQHIMVKEKLISALIAALFFAVFRPFGLSEFDWQMRFLLIFGVFVMAFISCVINEYFVSYVLRMPLGANQKPSYVIRRSVFFQVCNILLLSVFLALYLDLFACNERVNNHFSWQTYKLSLLVCAGISFFIGLYWRNVYLRRYYARQLEEAQLLNGVLMERARNAEFIEAKHEPHATNEEVKSQEVLLEGTTKDSVRLCISDFLFAESEGNYVCVHYLENDEAKQTMLRTSMKSVATILCTNPSVMQCHRAFLVNLLHVKSVEGRSSGIGLKLHHCSFVVPVSKGYVNDVKERIKNPVR